jgi:hypothetical protein
MTIASKALAMPRTQYIARRNSNDCTVARYISCYILTLAVHEPFTMWNPNDMTRSHDFLFEFELATRTYTALFAGEYLRLYLTTGSEHCVVSVDGNASASPIGEGILAKSADAAVKEQQLQDL